MAKANNVEFQVGVIILIGIMLLAGALYWLQGYKLQLNSQVIHVRFDDVGTLAAGDPVTVSGVRKGRVSDLALTRGGVDVELVLYKDVELRRDATFTIRNLGVMGERFIAVWPGNDSLMLDTGAVVSGDYDTGLPEVMGVLGDMVIELRSLVSSLKRTVASDESLDKFDRTASNLERISSLLVSILAENEEKVRITADNFLDASHRIRRLIATNAESADSSFSRLARASERLDRFTAQLDTLAQSARAFARTIEEEDGSLQMLLRDRRLYDDLRRTADNIDDLVLDIKANPRKYLNLQIKLF